MRMRDFDVVEYSKFKGKIGSNLINPIAVLQAKIKNLKEPLPNMDFELKQLANMVAMIEHQKSQCRTLGLKNISFFLRNPEILKEIDFQLERLIIGKFKFDEVCYPAHLGGEFSLAEKRYLIVMAKIKIKWDEVKRGELGDEENLGRRTEVGKSQGYSSLAYPSKNDIKVSNFLT
jgi:hypothetical protein